MAIQLHKLILIREPTYAFKFYSKNLLLFKDLDSSEQEPDNCNRITLLTLSFFLFTYLNNQRGFMCFIVPFLKWLL